MYVRSEHTEKKTKTGTGGLFLNRRPLQISHAKSHSFSEIIGCIDGIESPRIVGNKQVYKVLKFYLNNGNGRRIQVVAWNDDIENIIKGILD